MPRATLVAQHDIIEVPDSEEERDRQRNGSRNWTIELSSDSQHESPNPPKPTTIHTSLPVSSTLPSSPLRISNRGKRATNEIIELSSDTEDEPLFKIPSTSRRNQLATPARQESTPQDLLSKRTPAKLNGKRKYVVLSSSSEDENTTPEIAEPVQTTGSRREISPNKVRIQTNENDSDLHLQGRGVQISDDGTIEYTSTPRHPVYFTPNGKKSTARRRTLLERDPSPVPAEDLSWEYSQEKSGAISTGAVLPSLATPSGSGVEEATNEDVSIDQSKAAVESSTDNTRSNQEATKPTKPKRMPEAVAVLHRLAIPFLKELDRTVFDNGLGARYLPDLEPPPEPSASKKKGKKTVSSNIIGMGSRGEFEDGRGSYIELVWSNRMATTAGRTEYHRSSKNQVTIKIELGVKVVTNPTRLLNTLAHEASHAASWAISGDFSQPHGATFKNWSRKVMAAFPNVDITTRHGYEIEFKFTWKCMTGSCGEIYKRHSNSINTELQGCHCGGRLEPQFELPPKRAKKGTSTPQKASQQASASNNSPKPTPVASSRGRTPSQKRLSDVNMADPEVPDDDSFDVDTLLGVRVFFNPEKEGPEVKYLVSWAGYPAWEQTWEPLENIMGDLAESFNCILPADFNLQIVGNEWMAPNSFVDRRRELFYQENPEAVKRRSAALRQENEPLKPPLFEYASARAIRENDALHRRYLAKKASTSTKISVPPVFRPSKPPVKRPRSVYRRDGQIIIRGLHYNTKAQARSRIQAQLVSKYKSGLTQQKKKKSTVRKVTLRVPSPSKLSPEKENDYGSLFSDPDSSEDDVPLAVRAKETRILKPGSTATTASLPRPTAVQPIKNKPQKTIILSSSSEDDVPLSMLTPRKEPTKRPIAPNTIQNSDSLAAPKPPAASIPPKQILTLQTEGLKNPTITPISPLSRKLPQSRPNDVTPISAKAKAWERTGELIPLGKNRLPQTTSSKNEIGPETPVEKRPSESSDQMILDDPNVVTQSPVVMTMDSGFGDHWDQAAEFIHSIASEQPIPLVSASPAERLRWQPVQISLNSKKGFDVLCSVIFQKVTPQEVTPPSLKWISKDDNGFRIERVRPLSHLKILLHDFVATQHAQLGASEKIDEPLLAAFVNYLSDNSLCAIVNTQYREAKVCIYPSHQSPMDWFGLPPTSELRRGPNRLLVAVMHQASKKSKGPLDPQVSAPSGLYRHQNLDFTTKATIQDWRSGMSPSIYRGLLHLRLSDPIREALANRTSKELRSFSVFTLESACFLKENLVRNPGETNEVLHIDKITADLYPKYGIPQTEETVALIKSMINLSYACKPLMYGSARVVFIHNSAWDMLSKLPGLDQRKTFLGTWFYAYGPFHGLHPNYWGIREIFKRGGIITFTALAIIEQPIYFKKLIQQVSSSTIWIVYVTPLVVGVIYNLAISSLSPNDVGSKYNVQNAQMALWIVVQAISDGQLSLISPPPKYWKDEDWESWVIDSLRTSNASEDAKSTRESILATSELALTRFRLPHTQADSKCDCSEKLKGGWENENTSSHETSHGSIIQRVDRQTSADMRTMMAVPAFHTDYRRFVVLQAKQDGDKPAPTRDSIEHMQLQPFLKSDIFFT